MLDRRDPTSLELALGHRFSDRSLLQEALRDPSFANEIHAAGFEGNRRLALVGDAFLRLYVRETLARADETPSEISSRSDFLVSNVHLAEVAKELHLGTCLDLGKGGRKDASSLARAFEAVVGAAYFDAGYPAAAAVSKIVVTPRRSA